MLIDLSVHGMANGGSAVGRLEQRVVFVRGALPGERVRARVVKEGRPGRGGSWWKADLVEVLDASHDRIDSLCPSAAGQTSGCCDWDFLHPDAARTWKGKIALEQLSRVGKVAWQDELGAEKELRAESLGDPTHWRTRIRLAVGKEGRAGYHRYHSKDLVHELSCSQPVQGALAGIDRYRFTEGSTVLIAVDDQGERHIHSEERHRRGRGGAHPLQLLEGSGIARQYAGGREWLVSPSSFWQPHRKAAHRYTELVSQWVGECSGAVAWDLYGGVGLFAAVLAEAVGPAGRVYTVDAVSESSYGAQQSLADLPQVTVCSGVTERILPELPKAQVAVVDPPRSGAGRAVIHALSQTQRVVHIGCETAAFSRDVGLYREKGYQLVDLKVIDAYPLTHHMECFALLERKG